MATFSELVQQVNPSLGAKRVFGEPYEKNGVAIIPVARIMGGIGAGEGVTPEADGQPAKTTGAGGGFGISGGPVGVYVVKGDRVTWLPAVDVNRLMLGFQVVMVVFFLTVRTVVRTRAKAASLKAIRPA